MDGADEVTTFYVFDYLNFPFPDEYITHDIEYLEKAILSETEKERGQVLKTLMKYYNDCQHAKQHKMQPPPKPQGSLPETHKLIPFRLTAEVPLLVIIFFVIFN